MIWNSPHPHSLQTELCSVVFGLWSSLFFGVSWCFALLLEKSSADEAALLEPNVRLLILKDFIFVVRCEFGLSHVAFFGFSGHMRVG